MERSIKERFADLFNEADIEDNTYKISLPKLLIWLGVISIISSLTPFLFPGGYSLIKISITLIILLSVTASAAFRWAANLRTKK